MRDFIQAEDVAGLIGLPDGASFMRRRARLQREAGFPRPLPTSRRPLIWHRSRVEGWLAAQLSPTQDHKQGTHRPNLRLIEQASTR